MKIYLLDQVMAKEEVEFVGDLNSHKVELDHFLLEEEGSGSTINYKSDEDLTCTYGTIKGLRRFFVMVGTIRFDNFIIKFGI